MHKFGCIIYVQISKNIWWSTMMFRRFIVLEESWDMFEFIKLQTKRKIYKCRIFTPSNWNCFRAFSPISIPAMTLHWWWVRSTGGLISRRRRRQRNLFRVSFLIYHHYNHRHWLVIGVVPSGLGWLRGRHVLFYQGEWDFKNNQHSLFTGCIWGSTANVSQVLWELSCASQFV